MSESPVTLKLLIATTCSFKRVLFAEADKDCIDFLFQILTLPVATVVRLLRRKGMDGSLPNLYRSLNNLNDSYIQPNMTKSSFLKPAAPLSGSSVPLLALGYAPTNKKFYGCNKCSDYVSDSPLADCPDCRRKMLKNLDYVSPSAVSTDSGGLVKGMVTYMVMDDLVVKPMSTISTITLLNKYKVMDVGDLEEKVVKLGMDEALKLLKASLISKNVLTNVFC